MRPVVRHSRNSRDWRRSTKGRVAGALVLAGADGFLVALLTGALPVGAPPDDRALVLLLASTLLGAVLMLVLAVVNVRTLKADRIGDAGTSLVRAARWMSWLTGLRITAFVVLVGVELAGSTSALGVLVPGAVSGGLAWVLALWTSGALVRWASRDDVHFESAAQ